MHQTSRGREKEAEVVAVGAAPVAAAMLLSLVPVASNLDDVDR